MTTTLDKVSASVPDAQLPVQLPVLGAAMPIKHLGEHANWLLEPQQHGHDGRDLELQDSCRSEVIDGDWKPLVAEAKTMLEGFTGRIGIHGPYDGLHIGAWDGAVQRFVSERYLKALEFAEGLGEAFDAHGKLHMVMHSPFLFFGHPMVTHTKATGLEDQIGWVHATLEKVVERAASIGCVIVIENIRDTNPNPLLELVASFKSESVRMSLDVGHANLMQAIGGPTPDAWVRAAGNLLGHVHLQDNDAMNDYHWPAGRGSINWQTLLLAIKNLETMQENRPDSLVPPRLILEVREVEQAANFLVGHGLAV